MRNMSMKLRIKNVIFTIDLLYDVEKKTYAYYAQNLGTYNELNDHLSRDVIDAILHPNNPTLSTEMNSESEALNAAIEKLTSLADWLQ